MHPQAIKNRIRELAPGRKTTAAFMGWRPDLPDKRDFRFTASPHFTAGASLPVRAQDKRIFKQPVNDQGNTGSCTGQSTSVLHAIERKVSPRSALYTYWQARALIGETSKDDGAYIRDAVKSTNLEGVPRDDFWPQDESLVLQTPPPKADTDAAKRKIFNYYRLDADPGVQANRGQAYRSCLASKHCFVIGFTVYENFWAAGSNGGLAAMPQGGVDGGHAVLVYGYDDAFPQSAWGMELLRRGITPPSSVYLVRNSWGRDWGINGDFVIPTAYLEDGDLADDAWTTRAK